MTFGKPTQVNHCTSLHCKQIYVYLCPRCDVCVIVSLPRPVCFVLERNAIRAELFGFNWEFLGFLISHLLSIIGLTLRCNHEGHGAAAAWARYSSRVWNNGVSTGLHFLLLPLIRPYIVLAISQSSDAAFSSVGGGDHECTMPFISFCLYSLSPMSFPCTLILSPLFPSLESAPNAVCMLNANSSFA